ncbi:MAG: transcription initiation factor TFIIIB [Firmicutes bacterium HGW-Firmicutes-14]|jgi:RNA polymerase subunit RPABC4/transcription elongation factor Spt4|nr:MAG: transcription initiation factor TFIIIB [Firmicutes bacterium HGW-Firmicutes-14]
MDRRKECPECGSTKIGKGRWDGYAVLRPVGRFLSMGSRVFAEVCTECGFIVNLRAEKPEKFKAR